eukprot:4288668-Pleurochrysis_carterae.AAC.1
MGRPRKHKDETQPSAIEKWQERNPEKMWEYKKRHTLHEAKTRCSVPCLKTILKYGYTRKKIDEIYREMMKYIPEDEPEQPEVKHPFSDWVVQNKIVG